MALRLFHQVSQSTSCHLIVLSSCVRLSCPQRDRTKFPAGFQRDSSKNSFLPLLFDEQRWLQKSSWRDIPASTDSTIVTESAHGNVTGKLSHHTVLKSRVGPSTKFLWILEVQPSVTAYVRRKLHAHQRWSLSLTQCKQLRNLESAHVSQRTRYSKTGI